MEEEGYFLGFSNEAANKRGQKRNHQAIQYDVPTFVAAHDVIVSNHVYTRENKERHAQYQIFSQDPHEILCSRMWMRYYTLLIVAPLMDASDGSNSIHKTRNTRVHRLRNDPSSLVMIIIYKIEN